MSLKDDVLASWANARPLTDDEALAMAQEIVATTPKARGQFTDWFNQNLDYVRSLYG